MATKKRSAQTALHRPSAAPQPTSAVPTIDRGAELLKKAEGLLQAGRPYEAFELLKAHASSTDPRLRNARGVCLMRMDAAGGAIRIYRELVLGSGGLVLRSDVPVVYKTNYATALLRNGNVSGCVSILDEILDEQNQAVQKLRAAIRKWHSGLTFWGKLAWRLGSEPAEPIVLDFAPGDLE